MASSLGYTKPVKHGTRTEAVRDDMLTAVVGGFNSLFA